MDRKRIVTWSALVTCVVILLLFTACRSCEPIGKWVAGKIASKNPSGNHNTIAPSDSKNGAAPIDSSYQATTTSIPIATSTENRGLNINITVTDSTAKQVTKDLSTQATIDIVPSDPVTIEVPKDSSLQSTETDFLVASVKDESAKPFKGYNLTTIGSGMFSDVFTKADLKAGRVMFERRADVWAIINGNRMVEIKSANVKATADGSIHKYLFDSDMETVRFYSKDSKPFVIGIKQ